MTKEVEGFVSIDEYKGPIPPDVDTFGQSRSYGLHVGDAARIARLQEHVERLIFLLAECADFMDGQVDVVDGPDGPRPNRAMQLVSDIDDVLHGCKP